MSDGNVPLARKHAAEFLPADLDYIPEELEIRARAELFEDEDTKIKRLKLLRSMLEEEKDLRWQNDDLFLLAFLRARKFDVKRAFSLMKGFYSTMGKRGDLYYNMTFDHLKTVMAQNTLYFLPYRDNEGSIIWYTRFTDWNPQIAGIEELLVVFTFGLIQALRSPATHIAGFRLIVDFKDINLMHVVYVKPTLIGFFSDILKNSFPIRIRSIHATNENHFVSYFWAILKRLLPKKIADRVHFHGNDMKSLHKFIHPSLLPADLEGELPPYDNTDWQERMEASYDYLSHVRSFGYEKYMKQADKTKSPNSNERKE